MKATGRRNALLLLGLLSAGLILKGGVHPRHMGWVFLALSLLSLPQVEALDFRWPSRIAGKAFGLCFVLGVALQLLPVPAGVRTALSPETQSIYAKLQEPGSAGRAALWEQALLHDLSVEVGAFPETIVLEAMVLEGGTRDSQAVPARPVSLDRDKSQWVLGIWLGAGIVFLLSVQLARFGHSAFFLRGLFSICVAESLWGILNRNSGSLGLFPKEHYLGAASGTLVNANHFASLMLVGLAVGASLFYRSDSQRTRFSAWGIRIGLLLCGLGILASGSRAGMALAIFGLIWRPQQGEFNARKAAGWSAVVVALGLIGFVINSGPHGSFWASDPSLIGRLDIWTHGIHHLAGFPLVGSGLGTFSWIGRMGLEAPALFQFGHLHNDWLQLLVEGGLLIALPVFVAFGAAARAVLKRLSARGNPTDEIALAGAVLLVALHALVDFPFQIPAILWTVSACAGLLWGTVKEHPAQPARAFPLLPLSLLAALALVGLQSAKKDSIAQGNLRVLTDAPADLRTLEGQLLRERRGARKGLGRLALIRAQILSSQKNAGLLAAQNAAAAAKRRIQDQPLDTNAHLAEAAAWALYCELAKQSGRPARLTPEEGLMNAEVALWRAQSLESTNPRVFLAIARIQLRLERCSPFSAGHSRRSALALSRAVDLDPWFATESFGVAGALSDTDFEQIAAGSYQAHYEQGLGWRRRGQLEKARLGLERAASLEPGFAPTYFALGELFHSQRLAESKSHFQRYLQLETHASGMGAWSTLRLGDAAGAVIRFEHLLEKEPGRIWLRNGLKAAENALTGPVLSPN
jgi:O-antigen ligase